MVGLRQGHRVRQRAHQPTAPAVAGTGNAAEQPDSRPAVGGGRFSSLRRAAGSGSDRARACLPGCAAGRGRGCRHRELDRRGLVVVEEARRIDRVRVDREGGPSRPRPLRRLSPAAAERVGADRRAHARGPGRYRGCRPQRRRRTHAMRRRRRGPVSVTASMRSNPDAASEARQPRHRRARGRTRRSAPCAGDAARLVRATHLDRHGCAACVHGTRCAPHPRVNGN